eukprot:TRINITY_DN20831_c0_g1_i6.p1 TRINITY_DN20831_c0_g1~~TRINITY_DN20831_c0_g1_i6.p1  ORF type:complete len:648 (-),score=54.86 TRINITY_DN20831_c0_g1_i6:216-2090(-)
MRFRCNETMSSEKVWIVREWTGNKKFTPSIVDSTTTELWKTLSLCEVKVLGTYCPYECKVGTPDTDHVPLSDGIVETVEQFLEVAQGHPATMSTVLAYKDKDGNEQTLSASNANDGIVDWDEYNSATTEREGTVDRLSGKTDRTDRSGSWWRVSFDRARLVNKAKIYIPAIVWRGPLYRSAVGKNITVWVGNDNTAPESNVLCGRVNETWSTFKSNSLSEIKVPVQVDCSKPVWGRYLFVLHPTINPRAYYSRWNQLSLNEVKVYEKYTCYLSRCTTTKPPRKSTYVSTTPAEKCDDYKNHALKKPASQSSLASANMSAKLAVDGVADRSLDSSTKTNVTTHRRSWWKVDLQYLVSIEQFVIFGPDTNDGTRVSNFCFFTVHLSNVSDDQSNRTLCYKEHDYLGTNDRIVFSCDTSPIVARYVWVESGYCGYNPTNQLHLNEVQVLGKRLNCSVEESTTSSSTSTEVIQTTTTSSPTTSNKKIGSSLSVLCDGCSSGTSCCDVDSGTVSSGTKLVVKLETSYGELFKFLYRVVDEGTVCSNVTKDSVTSETTFQMTSAKEAKFQPGAGTLLVLAIIKDSRRRKNLCRLYPGTVNKHDEDCPCIALKVSNGTSVYSRLRGLQHSG